MSPRWIRCKSRSQSQIMPEQQQQQQQQQQPATARAELKQGRLNMLKGTLDFKPLTSPRHTISPVDGSPIINGTPVSCFTTFPHLIDIYPGKATKFPPPDPYPEDAATNAARASHLAFLQFCPTESTNYARHFARAISAAYRSNLFPDASQKDRALAERVVQGEGGDLVFRPAYIATGAMWNGENTRHRRAALTHILGVSAADCKVEGCPYGGTACVCCENPASGVFEGCRHSHENPLKLGCTNCAAGSNPSRCSVRSVRKDSRDINQEHVLDERLSRNSVPSKVERRMRRSSSHGLIRDSTYGSDDKRYTTHIGPVVDNFFVSGSGGAPSDFDVWMAMRKRAIDYEPEVLALECRLAKLWSSVLEDELGKQNAAGLQQKA